MSMTPSAEHERFKQAVRDAVDLIEIASEHGRLEQRGKRWVGLCPFHDEKTPSFSIDPERGLYHCFGCGVGGDAIKFYMETTGEDFPTALESLAARYGIPLPKQRHVSDKERRLEEALEAAAGFFRDQLTTSSFAQRYLEQRRVGAEAIERFGLGYAPDDWQQLTGALSARFPVEALESAGLVARSPKSQRVYDRFRHRLIFPIHSPTGRLVGFGGRTLGEDRAKYINTAETTAFQKKHLLYGLHLARNAIRQRDRVLLVEGYFDVIAAVLSGVEEAVASMGTSLTPQQVKLLARYADRVIVGYDGDRAGEQASRKALPLLLGAGLEVRRACFPAGQDPDSLRLEEGEEAIRRVIAEAPDAVELSIERLPPTLAQSPHRQARAADRVAAVLGRIPDSVLRYAYSRRAAERLGLPEDVLWQRIQEDTTRAASTEEGPPPRGLGATRSPSAVDSGSRRLAGLEERVLQLLILGEASQDRDRLPPEGAFLDDSNRRIYRIYLELREEGDASSSLDRRLQERLVREPEGGQAIDRLAYLLLEETALDRDGDLTDGLERLTQRWNRQRSRQLARELAEAERQGDEKLLRELLDEKAVISRRMHQGPKAD